MAVAMLQCSTYALPTLTPGLVSPSSSADAWRNSLQRVAAVHSVPPVVVSTVVVIVCTSCFQGWALGCCCSINICDRLQPIRSGGLPESCCCCCCCF